MADQLGMVLFGDLDINKTVKNINSQIVQIENKLKAVNLSFDINIKSAFKEIENVTSKISKNAKDSINEELRLAEQIAKLREKSESKTQKVNRDNELKQASAINKALEEQYKLEKDIALWKEKQEINISKLSSKGNIDTSELSKLKESLSRVSAESIDARNEMKSFQNELTRVNITANKSSDSILKTAMSYFTLYDAFQLGKRVISSSIESVRELDEELTNLAKVTDLNSDGLDNMTKKAFELGNEIGRTGSEVVSNMALFAQAGYSQNDLEDLARASLLYQNVSDTAMSAEESVGYVVAALKAFHLEASSAIDVGSALNSVSNKNAVGFENLADGLARTASVYSQSNTSMNELLGLLSGGYEISRNMEKTASGLITISTRLRAVQLQGEEAVMPIAKLQETFKNMANVDIIDPVTNELRGTYDILESLYEVWDSLNSLQQESIAFAAAGTRQKSVFLDLMSNFEGVKKAADDAKFSIGSMEQENARYLDSINGRMSLFSSAWSNMSNNFISSDFVKSMVDIGTNTVNTIDKIGVLNTSLIALTGTMVLVGKAKNITWLTSLPSMLGAATSGVTALTSALLSNPLFLGAVGLVGAIKLIDALTVTLYEQREKVEKLENGYSELTSELEQLRSIENPTEANERKIQLLERELELQEKLLDIEKQKLVDKEYSAYYSNLNSGLESLIQNINIYKEQTEMMANPNISDTHFKMLKKTSDVAYEGIVKYASELNDAYSNMDSILNDLDDTQKENVKTLMNSANTYLNLSDEILGIGEKTKNAKESMDGFNASVSSVNESLENTSSEERDLSQSVSELSKQFESASDKIATLNTISKELKESNGLSADSFKKIASEFPDLLGYMNDEASLADAIKDKMESLSAVQGDAYRQMLFNSEEYYEQNVLGNEQMVNSISSGIENLFRNLSTAYDGDLNNWKTLAQGKADIETQLIASLNKAWESHFGTLMTQFNKMANTPVANPQFDEAKYKEQLSKDNPFLTSTQLDRQLELARNAFNKQTSDYKQFQAEVVKRNQELSNMFSDVKFDAVDIKIGGGKGSKSKKKSSKDSFEKYYSQLIDEKIDVILSENERLEDAIAFAQEKLANAELKGDIKQQETLNKQILEFTKQKKELSHKMAEELRKVGNDVRIQLGNMNIKGYENFNFENLTQLDVSKITQSFDKLAVGASDAVKANIEVQKSKFQELANVVMRIYGEEIPNLQKQWWAEDTNHTQQQIDRIHEIADLEKRAYDDKLKQYELEQMLYEDDSEEYKAIEQQKLDDLLELQKSYLDKVRRLKEMGLSIEQEDVRKYIDMYVDLEEQRINMVKQFAEQRRQIEVKANQEAMDDLRDVQNSPKELLDMVMSMLRQETEDKKEELDKQLENKKDALKEEYDAEKKAIEDKLDLIRKEADERKKALQKEQDERNYNRGLEEKQKQIKDVEDKLLALSNDDSIHALKKRKELEAELAKYKKELEDYQYDHQISIREDAIDEELEAQEDKLNKELEALDDRYDKELDMLDKKHKQEIKKYEEMLSSQKKLREEALRLIEKGERELYDKLIAWNDEYGSGISEDISNAWDNAYSAMKTYGDGSNNVLQTMVAMREEMERLVEESENLAESTWKDYADEEDLKPGGGGSKPNNNNPSSSNKPWGDKYDGLEEESERAEYRDKQLKKMIELGDEMNRTPSADKEKIKRLKQEQQEIANTIGAYNQGGTWYIVINKKKYRVRDAIGVRHDGLKSGRVGDGLKPNEQIMKLTKDEWVLTGSQMSNLTANIDKILKVNAVPPQPVNPVINLNVGSVTKDTLPDLKKFLKVEVPKILNDTLISKGIRGR